MVIHDGEVTEFEENHYNDNSNNITDNNTNNVTDNNTNNITDNHPPAKTMLKLASWSSMTEE